MEEYNSFSRSHLSDFSNLFALSKTLRFKLIPMGRTQEFITREQFIEIDEDRSLAYQKAKTLIDQFHKKFIDEVLSAFSFCKDKDYCILDDYFECYCSDGESRKSILEKLSDTMRKSIAQAFKADKRYASLFKAELFSQLLPTMQLSEDDKNIIKKFDKFTTYFTGFHKNRENMYLAEAKSTSIAYRIVDVNLIKYIENYLIIRDNVLPQLPSENIAQLTKDFSGKLNGLTIEQFFAIKNFNHVLCQDDIDAYNAVLGGRLEDDGKNILKGLNQYINLYNQVHEKNERLPFLQPLFKQILSDRNHLFIPEPKEVTNAIFKSFQTINKDILPQLEEILRNLTQYNLSGIFIKNDTDLSLIAQRYFGAFDAVSSRLKEQYRTKNPMRKGANEENYEKQVNKYVKDIDSRSLAQINELMGPGAHCESYFQSLGAINNEMKQQENIFALIQNRYHDVFDCLNDEDISNEKLRKHTEDIKNFLDAIMLLKWFVKPLIGHGNETGRDMVFYGNFSPLYEKLDEIITPLYSMVRNYLTRKPFSTEKFKLNFENPILLGSWTNPEQYSCALFREDKASYFLAILHQNERQILQYLEIPDDDDDDFEMVDFKQGGDMGKNVQNLMRIGGKVVKKNGRREKTGPNAGDNLILENLKNLYLPQKINDIRLKESYKINSPNFKKDDLEVFIEYYIPLVREYYSNFNFHFKNSEEYRDFNEFTSHVNQQSYQIRFKRVSKKHLFELNKLGKIFIFQIYNKDFSSYSKGRPNLHTIYWKMLFDERNLADVVYKLNGQAEMFYRHKTKGEFITHKANKSIENKSEFNKIHKPTSSFEYDIIKDRRYSTDHYELHVPITMNYHATERVNLNNEAKRFIKQQGIRHIIGIDRGERHLLYLTMIDLNGKIVKQFSLNHIASNPNAPDFTQDYHTILDKKEGDRLHARQNWATIDQIKDLKSGYLSQVVHIIAKMMIENDAIVVLENLNTGFMRGRQKVEKSVYQKFEKALIDKLNYIVDKSVEADQPGGALHAIQLTGTYDQFCRTQKGNVRQSGFVFYIPAWNTSKIDPVTGFTNMFDLRLTSMDAIKSFFRKMNAIRYDAENDFFTFSFDYNDSRSKWTITTKGERIYTHRSKDDNNNFVNDTVDVSARMKELFLNNGAPLNGNLKEFIARADSREFLFELLHLFKLTMQMRNSATGTEIDYIISPAIDKNGNQYDSRDNNPELPLNADANGAYNIARKGQMLVEQIMQCDDVEQVKYDITNKNWLKFAQK